MKKFYCFCSLIHLHSKCKFLSINCIMCLMFLVTPKVGHYFVKAEAWDFHQNFPRSFFSYQTGKMFQDFLLLLKTNTLHVGRADGHLSCWSHLNLVNVQSTQSCKHKWASEKINIKKQLQKNLSYSCHEPDKETLKKESTWYIVKLKMFTKLGTQKNEKGKHILWLGQVELQRGHWK